MVPLAFGLVRRSVRPCVEAVDLPEHLIQSPEVRELRPVVRHAYLEQGLSLLRGEKGEQLRKRLVGALRVVLLYHESYLEVGVRPGYRKDRKSVSLLSCHGVELDHAGSFMPGDVIEAVLVRSAHHMGHFADLRPVDRLLVGVLVDDIPSQLVRLGPESHRIAQPPHGMLRAERPEERIGDIDMVQRLASVHFVSHYFADLRDGR